MRQTMFIMQGWPGSGKSTLAQSIALTAEVENQRAAPDDRHLHPTCVVCSTDDYHNDADGVYRFKPKLLGEYHRRNQVKADAILTRGQSVVVDNTNTRCYEAKPYVVMALSLGVPVVFIRCTGTWDNVHGIPAEKVKEMTQAIEELSVARCISSLAPWE